MSGAKPSPADHGRSEIREKTSLVRALAREQRRLGQRLKALRLEQKLSQETAAERIGLSAKHLRRLELGQANVTLATLVACAIGYRVAVAELLRGPEG